MGATTAWKCEVCGYVHEGDEAPAGCPVCGVGREMFAPLEAVAATPAAAAERWRCTICDHVHDGTSPPDSCPVCGAGRDQFEPLTTAPEAAVAESPVGRIVVLGGGIAGVTAAEYARRTAPDAEVALIDRGWPLPYYRLNLTRYLAGEVGSEGLPLHPESWFEEQRIMRLVGEVDAIDRYGRRVSLAAGGGLPYDRLVLATGAHAFVPPIPGVERDGVHPLRTTADADAILAAARPGARCVVLGGGLLGLEAAGALAGRGLDVTVLEGYGYLLPRQLTREGGELVLSFVRDRGITVRTDVMASRIVGEDRIRGVELAGGEVLPADLLLVATGVRPNTAIARQAGLTVKGGLIVDDQLRTSDPAILGAGDGTEHRGRLYGIWPASYAQGVVAGINAAGGQADFLGIPPSNVLKVLGVDVFSIGDFEAGDGSFAVHEARGEGWYRRLVCRDGRILGANLVGDTSAASAVRDVVESGDSLAEHPDLRARFPELLQG